MKPSAAVSKPSLIVVGFVPLDSPAQEESEARTYLASLWEACASLGMRDPIEPLDLPVEIRWPKESETAEIELLAARESRAPGSAVYQALAFAIHDVLVVSIALAPNQEGSDLSQWKTLQAKWTEASAERPLPADAIGEALIFSALLEDDSDREALAAEVGASLPGEGVGPRPLSFLQTEDDFLVWEAQGEGERRRVAVLAPRSRERQLDRWIWWDPAEGRWGLHRGLVSLLLQVLKIHYEHRIYEVGSAHLHASEEAVDSSVDDLLSFLNDMQERRPDRFPIGELLAAQDRLVRDEAGTGGLLLRMSKLKELRRTVEIAEANVRSLTPQARSGSAASLFVQDLAVAAALMKQIDDDIAYGEALQERAREAQRLAGLRIEQASQHYAREQNRLTLFQATLVGSLLAGFGAASAVGLDVGLIEGLQLPFVFLLTSSLFALPHLIVNWPERYHALDYATSMFLGASTLWFAARLAGWSTDAAPFLSVIAGGLCGPAIAWTLEKVVAARERLWLRQEPEWRWVRAARERLTFRRPRATI